MADYDQPIIIKKIKKKGHAHHGGAWKIAYADFVTAMMAFFLLMWLLGSTAKGDLQGIADFFQNPLKVGMSGGSGIGDASSVIQGGGKDLTRTAGQVKSGEVEAKRKTINLKETNQELMRKEFEAKEKAMLGELKQRIEKLIEGNPALKQTLRLMGPMVLGLSVLQINVLMDSAIARWLSETASTGEFSGRSPWKVWTRAKAAHTMATAGTISLRSLRVKNPPPSK